MTYANIAQMYEHIYDGIIDEGVAVKLESPIWQNRYGNIHREEDSFGCKVTHDLNHPEMCIVMDVVGRNKNQKGDGHIETKLLICAKGTISHKKYKR